MEYYGIEYKGLTKSAFAQKIAHLKYIREGESKENPLNALFGRST